jgi:5-methylcytosine-specific restriction endonuclease McrA
MKNRKPKQKPNAWYKCRGCKMFHSKQPSERRFKCDVCKNKSRLAKYDPVPKLNKHCDSCGEQFESTHNILKKKSVCNLCVSSSHKARSSAIRRSRMALVKVERVYRKKVWDRDGWKCLMCGIAVNLNQDSNSKSYPTIDHIVPVSKGGNHTMDNVMLLCRSCNSVKGNKIVASDVDSRRLMINCSSLPPPSFFPQF